MILTSGRVIKLFLLESNSFKGREICPLFFLLVSLLNIVAQGGFLRPNCELNENLTASDNLQFKFGTDGDGNYGYYGADGSLVPFKSIGLLGSTTGNTPLTVKVGLHQTRIVQCVKKIATNGFGGNFPGGTWGSYNINFSFTYNADTGVITPSGCKFTRNINDGSRGITFTLDTSYYYI